jgi:hypothetical protein
MEAAGRERAPASSAGRETSFNPWSAAVGAVPDTWLLEVREETPAIRPAGLAEILTAAARSPISPAEAVAVQAAVRRKTSPERAELEAER